MNTTTPAPQPTDPRRRLRELLSIPERDRTEEQWDEIVELEIQLAPGNRVGMTGMPTGGKPGMGNSTASGNGPSQPRKNRPPKGNAGGAPRRPNKPAKPKDPAA